MFLAGRKGRRMVLFTRAISQNRNRQGYLGKKRLEKRSVNHFSRGNDRNTRDPWNERRPFNQNYVLYAEADHCAWDGPCVTAVVQRCISFYYCGRTTCTVKPEGPALTTTTVEMVLFQRQCIPSSSNIVTLLLKLKYLFFLILLRYIYSSTYFFNLQEIF